MGACPSERNTGFGGTWVPVPALLLLSVTSGRSLHATHTAGSCPVLPAFAGRCVFSKSLNKTDTVPEGPEGMFAMGLSDLKSSHVLVENS